MTEFLPNVIVLYSSSYVLKRRALQELQADILAEEDYAYALEHFWADEDKLETILAELSGSSLLANQRVVVIHEIQRLRAKEQEELAKQLQALSPGTYVIMTVTPASSREKKLPLAAPLFKFVQQHGEIRELPAPSDKAIIGWIGREAAQYGKTMAPEAAEWLKEIAGTDVDRLANEIAKLSHYVGANPIITREDVQAACSALDERGVFELVDALSRRDAATATDIIHALLPPGMPGSAQISAAYNILGMIARQIRLLWQTVYALKSVSSLENIPSQISVIFPQETGLDTAHPFVREKLTAQARHFTESQLARALVRVYEADLMLKGLGEQKAEARTILELLVVSLCQI